MNVEAITREQTQSAPALTSTPIPTTHAGNFRDVLQRNDPLHTIRTRTSAGVPVHTVKAGETLSDICRKALQDAKKDASDAATWVAVQKVARENNLKNPDLINPGQILNVSSLQSIKIPVIGLEPASKSATASPAAATTASAATPVVRVAPLPPPVASSAAQAVSTASPTVSRPKSLVFRDASLASSYLNKTAKTAPRADLSDLIQTILNPAPAKAVTATAPSAPSEITLPSAAAATSSDTPTPSGPWAKLLSTPAHLTSEFGVRKDPFNGHMSMHPGIDLAADKGSKIYPIEPGKVTYSGWMEGYGKVVIVRHQDGLESVYGHNSSNLAKVGDTVSTTTPIGLVGSTGRSTGAHLHFEIRKNGAAVDPIPVMKSELLQVAKAL